MVREPHIINTLATTQTRTAAPSTSSKFMTQFRWNSRNMLPFHQNKYNLYKDYNAFIFSILRSISMAVKSAISLSEAICPIRISPSLLL